MGRPRRYCRRSCRQRAYEERHAVRDRDWLEGRITELSRRLGEVEDERSAVRDELDLVLVELRDGRLSAQALAERLAGLRAELDP